MIAGSVGGVCAVPAKTCTFFLVPRFSMLAFTSAVDPLYTANRLSGGRLYDWRVVSRDGGPVVASNGLQVAADAAMADVGECEALYVCAGLDAHVQADRNTTAWLRRVARGGALVGGLCSGTHLLARAGLLDGHRCTIHWEDLRALSEEFPGLEVTANLFEIDRKRITCAGGTAALDLMLHLIGLVHGAELAGRVSEQFMHQRIRAADDHQRMAPHERLGVRKPKLLAAIGAMEANLEDPLSLGEIARAANLSVRQLERLFKQRLGSTPSRYYLDLRLHHARLLLMRGASSILAIALAAGFASASHFSRRYREHFGRSPREERGFASSFRSSEP